jgi:hypothetical protein
MARGETNLAFSLFTPAIMLGVKIEKIMIELRLQFERMTSALRYARWLARRDWCDGQKSHAIKVFAWEGTFTVVWLAMPDNF